MEGLISMVYLSQVSSQSFVINTVTVLVWFAWGKNIAFLVRVVREVVGQTWYFTLVVEMSIKWPIALLSSLFSLFFLFPSPLVFVSLCEWEYGDERRSQEQETHATFLFKLRISLFFPSFPFSSSFSCVLLLPFLRQNLGWALTIKWGEPWEGGMFVWWRTDFGVVWEVWMECSGDIGVGGSS